MDYKEKASKAAELRAEATKLEKQSYDERPLPECWKVGQKVRYLKDKEWAWDAGQTAYVKEVRKEDEGKSAAQYQVFWTGPTVIGGSTYWTTPSEVELAEDVNPSQAQ